MKNEFVPYEEALAMKELGFDEPCFGSWCQEYDKPYLSIDRDVLYLNEHLCLSPTYSQAFRWFRRKEGWYITIYRGSSDWVFKISDMANKTIAVGFDNMDYEEAELACLRKLIEIVNQNKENVKETK